MTEENKNSGLDRDEEYIINIGPQHPSTHGVLRLVVSLKGEIVKSVEPHCGYIHRGIEKMCEKLTYPQIIHLTDRLDYLSAHINNEAVCLCVEKALEIEVPERVKYIRAILSELTRIQSHVYGYNSPSGDAVYQVGNEGRSAGCKHQLVLPYLCSLFGSLPTPD